MLQEKNTLENENINTDQQDLAVESGVKLAVKKKRFKKSDILVIVICIIASVLIWMYASNLQKKAAEKEISKEDIVEVVESGMNKNTEMATDIMH